MATITPGRLPSTLIFFDPGIGPVVTVKAE
jgi:hypothetical protein